MKRSFWLDGGVLLVAASLASTGAYGQTTSKIVFHTDRDGNSDVYIMNEDGTGQTNLTNNSAVDEYPVLCGNKIVFTSNRGGSDDVWRMGVDGSNPTNLTPNTSGSADHEPHCGSTAQLSNTVVFRSDRDGNDEIYSVKTDGTDLKRLTYHSYADENPQWCGNEIMFIRDEEGRAACVENSLIINPGSDYQLYIMGAAGEGIGGAPARAVTCTPYNSSPPQPPCDPSADDTVQFYWPACFTDAAGQRYIAFSAYLPVFYSAREIFRMDLCSSGCCADSPADLTQLTETATTVDDDYPSWSLGGSFIYFGSNRLSGGTTDWEIYRMDAEDGDPVAQVTTDAADDADPHAGEAKP